MSEHCLNAVFRSDWWTHGGEETTTGSQITMHNMNTPLGRLMENSRWPQMGDGLDWHVGTSQGKHVGNSLGADIDVGLGRHLSVSLRRRRTVDLRGNLLSVLGTHEGASLVMRLRASLLAHNMTTVTGMGLRRIRVHFNSHRPSGNVEAPPGAHVVGDYGGLLLAARDLEVDPLRVEEGALARGLARGKPHDRASYLGLRQAPHVPSLEE